MNATKATRIANPEDEAIDRLERIGVFTEQGDDRRWRAKRRRDGALLPGTSHVGCDTRAYILTVALALCGAMLQAARDTDAAYREYVTVSRGRYTGANPEKFANLYRAKREYERVEACKLGLPVRPDAIAAGRAVRG